MLGWCLLFLIFSFFFGAYRQAVGWSVGLAGLAWIWNRQAIFLSFKASSLQYFFLPPSSYAIFIGTGSLTLRELLFLLFLETLSSYYISYIHTYRYT
ncbi:hypothetical protein F4811DRAFT_516969 [Daldinia bambusicola]|nr:hypothetical protein F4811DRAFT_516969 [Daldinia bambusicola]